MIHSGSFGHSGFSRIGFVEKIREQNQGNIWRAHNTPPIPLRQNTVLAFYLKVTNLTINVFCPARTWDQLLMDSCDGHLVQLLKRQKKDTHPQRTSELNSLLLKSYLACFYVGTTHFQSSSKLCGLRRRKSSLKVKKSFRCWRWSGISCQQRKVSWNLRKIAVNFTVRNEVCKWPYKEQSVLRKFQLLYGSVSPLPPTSYISLGKRLMPLCLQVLPKSRDCGGEKVYKLGGYMVLHGILFPKSACWGEGVLKVSFYLVWVISSSFEYEVKRSQLLRISKISN